MHRHQSLILLLFVLVLAFLASLLTLAGWWGEWRITSSVAELQTLTGGLGFGPATHLAPCPRVFDPRLQSSCVHDSGPIPGGIHFCEGHAGSVFVVQPIEGVVDTAFIERLGAASTAVLGAATALLAGVLWIFNFLGVGTQTEVAHVVG